MVGVLGLAAILGELAMKLLSPAVFAIYLYRARTFEA
jgi:hypothetical protein